MKLCVLIENVFEIVLIFMQIPVSLIILDLDCEHFLIYIFPCFSNQIVFAILFITVF